jgi:hypothetical protein
VWIFRAALLVLPALVYLLTKRICDELRRTGWHPLRGPAGPTVTRTASGGFARVSASREAGVSEMPPGSDSA